MTEEVQKDQANEYGADSIKVLKGLDAVRKRPGMYIGDTDDGSGLHHMVYEVIDNSIDEALAGYCSLILVKIHKDGSVSIKDNGRGIPVDLHPEEKVSAAEVIMTVLHAGGKFDSNSYKVSGGLHGVGVSVVNALSDKLQLTIWRQGHIYQQIYTNGGKPVEPLKIIGDSDQTGTEIRFWPSPEIFVNYNISGKNIFDYNILTTRIRELSFLNSGVKIQVVDERSDPIKDETFHHEDGIKGFVEYINENLKKKKKDENEVEVINPKIFYVSKPYEQSGITVEIAMQWNTTYDERVLCFTNNIPQKDGGTHLSGFRTSLTRTLNDYIEMLARQGKQASNRKEQIVTEGSDCREGLTAIVSVKVPDPKFSSQTKDKLVSSEVSGAVSKILNVALKEYLEENPSASQAIIAKIISSAKAREAAKRAREKVHKENIGSLSLPAKLAQCNDKEPSHCELFLVEGDSAGGSAKDGRNRDTQAILPLRGKILNIEKATTDKMLNSQEITNLISALNLKIKDLKISSNTSANGEDEDSNTSLYNLDKLRYHKIIIMTDADVDGAHISVLLLTFLFRQIPELFEKGYVYIANPPLYKISMKGKKSDSKKSKDQKNVFYVRDDQDRDDKLITIAVEKADFYTNNEAAPINSTSLCTLIQNYLRTQSSMKKLVTNFQFPEKIINKLLFVRPLLSSMFSNKEEIQAWLNDFAKLYENTGDFITLFAFDVIERKDPNTNVIKYYPRVTITDHGVRTYFVIDESLVDNYLYNYTSNQSDTKRKIYSVVNEYNEISTLIDDDTAYLQIGENKPIPISHFSQVVEILMERAKNSVDIQRYKGLGEMNKDQLFDTTMDPENRVLKQVSIKDASEASSWFANLMGDDVLFRKQFISDNALNANLDY